MKLTEALKLLQKTPPEHHSYEVLLVCGFTPLHLQTFVGAHLQQRLPGRRVKIRTGLYGDVAGTLESAAETGDLHGLAVALEWSDVDPRLGYRGAGAWKAVGEFVASARVVLQRMERAILRLPAGLPVAIALPSVPLPPLFHPPGGQISLIALELEKALLEFASACTMRPGCAIVHPASVSGKPIQDRYDFKGDLATGLPYPLPHADVVGEALAQLLSPPSPKKGIITDLDDTLWFGIVGEVGAQNVSWDLASHRQLHGLYQNLLSTLAEEGVLVAIASKNDPAIAEQALQREDLIIRPRQIFPVEISWGAKSIAVKRIIETWNIGADSVIFVDDSPMELAEVSSAHPGIECVLFPKDDPAAGFVLLQHLRNRCGKPRLSEEDALRLESIRQGQSFREAQENGNASEEFLMQAAALVTIDLENVAEDARSLELINKTNQFNLNGARISEGDWRQRLSQEGVVAGSVTYQDRFGPLGKISVFQGRRTGNILFLDAWVMSCRAFARRIEFQCVKILLEHCDVDTIRFDYRPTVKNGPLREFLQALLGRVPEEGPVTLSRKRFEKTCPALYHQVKVKSQQKVEVA